jgi:hypothetical protein
LRGGLERAGFGLTSGNAADAIVKTTVTKELGDYRIRADYAAQGQPALSVESTCELCGVDELGESLASVGGHLRRRVTRLDEAATLRVTSSPEGAEVRLNGELLGETPLETEVKAGAYELSVGSEGYKTEERGVDLEPATQASFQMTLRRQGFKKWLPWVLLGAGGAALIPGIALIAIDQNEIQRDCNPDIDGRCQYLYDTMPGGVTLTIAGAGLLISGATLAILWRPDRGRGKFAQRLSPAPGGLTLRF